MSAFILKHMKPGDCLPIRWPSGTPRHKSFKLTEKQRALVALTGKRHGLVFTCRARRNIGVDVYCKADHGTRRHQVDENIRRIFCRQVDKIPRNNKPGLMKGVRSKAYTSYVRAQAREARERISID